MSAWVLLITNASHVSKVSTCLWVMSPSLTVHASRWSLLQRPRHSVSSWRLIELFKITHRLYSMVVNFSLSKIFRTLLRRLMKSVQPTHCVTWLYTWWRDKRRVTTISCKTVSTYHIKRSHRQENLRIWNLLSHPTIARMSLSVTTRMIKSLYIIRWDTTFISRWEGD